MGLKTETGRGEPTDSGGRGVANMKETISPPAPEERERQGSMPMRRGGGERTISSRLEKNKCEDSLLTKQQQQPPGAGLDECCRR
ncbi:unnamed protein product [Arabidopsis lyrata]|uniref:Predicted protein n=1 Tax=Arabidopsis lyrata subsp. lyrata TaxID=81972 RepID=D7ML77_ARALL|nr:predicted protein [Arabidopsis lyrata subsp. lyrata]CAH8279833.1 unnamed protein product [Arabidopsis lyrata]